MSGDSALVECSVSYQWRFEAPLGLVGVPTRDGRLLVVPEVADGPPWSKPLPLPVLGFARASRPGDGQGGIDHPAVPVARLEQVVLHEAELVGSGAFADNELGRHYAGALALDVVAFGLDLDQAVLRLHDQPDGDEEPTVDEPAVYETWRIAGAHLVQDSPWERRYLSHPRVWREKLTGP